MSKGNDYYFKRADCFSEKEISLDYLDLQILSLIEQNKSAREIGNELQISSALLKMKIMGLYKNKVIQLADNVEFMDRDFSECIRRELLQLIGPMGSIVLEDVLESMRLNTDTIPKKVSREIVYMIEKEIPEPDCGRKFVLNMFEKMETENW